MQLLPASDGAVGAFFRTADENAVFTPDDLTTSERCDARLDGYVVTATLEFFYDTRVAVGFDFDVISIQPLPACRIERGLRIEMEVYRVHDDLDMTLRLHEGAHDTERADRCAVFRKEAGDDGMIRFFTRADTVRAGRVEVEVLSAVVERDARTGTTMPAPRSL